MKFQILTLFPEAFDSFLSTSIIGRAIENKLIEVELVDVRQYTTDKHKKVDDVPYGGGAGMVMMCQPFFAALEALEADEVPVIFFTPSRTVFEQPMAEAFAIGEIPEGMVCDKSNDFDRVILICGRYEGLDQRIRDRWVDIELSMGAFVLTGGELPAQIFIDAIGRLVPGVLGKEESHLEESFSKSLGRNSIEHPHYTRPSEFEGMAVPEILMSGHHAKIDAWRRTMSQQK